VSPFGILRVALRALLKNRLRSALTMLGIIIGVGAFVAMVAIGQGVRAKVTSSIAGMGSNMVVVFPGSSVQGGARGGMGSSPTLTLDDAEGVGRLSSVSRAAPVVRGSAQLVYGAANWPAPVIGTTPDYFDIRNWTLEQGGFFTEDDVRIGAKVCVIGRTVQKNLFGEGVDPVGQAIRVKSTSCKVIGLLAEKGSNAFGGDEDDVVLLPVSTVKRRITGGDPQLVNLITTSAVSGDSTTQAQAQIEGLLRQRHRIGEGQPDDFVVRDLRELARTQGEAAGILTKLLGSIALVSLLVGGIGIMNIMLVSVTERTREIGIRVALGARGVDIMTQFVVEAVLLCILGGGVGVLLGWYTSGVLAEAMDWPSLVSPISLVIAFAFAALIGLVFGLYPAIRASRLDPIEALRYE
jgi:putative ABC transport system permease protein